MWTRHLSHSFSPARWQLNLTKKMTNDRQVQRFSPTTVQCDIKLSLQWKEKWHCAVWHQTKRRRGGVRNAVLLSRWWERWGEFSHCWSERSPQNLTLRQWFIGFVKSSCCRETIGLAGAYLEEGGSQHIIRQGSHLLPSTSGLWPRGWLQCASKWFGGRFKMTMDIADIATYSLQCS